MRVELVAVLGLAAGLVGCATVSYEEPTEGPMSQVRFVVEDDGDGTFMGGGGNLNIRSYETRNCDGEDDWMSLRNGPLVASSPRTLDMPLNKGFHKNAFKEFKVSTQAPLRLLFDHSLNTGQMTYSCAVFVEETLDPNKDYELSFKYREGQNCSVDINEITETARIPIRSIDNRISAESEGCLAVFNKTRW